VLPHPLGAVWSTSAGVAAVAWVLMSAEGREAAKSFQSFRAWARSPFAGVDGVHVCRSSTEILAARRLGFSMSPALPHGNLPVLRHFGG
jgi:hypothetical protein